MVRMTPSSNTLNFNIAQGRTDFAVETKKKGSLVIEKLRHILFLLTFVIWVGREETGLAATSHQLISYIPTYVYYVYTRHKMTVVSYPWRRGLGIKNGNQPLRVIQAALILLRLTPSSNTLNLEMACARKTLVSDGPIYRKCSWISSSAVAAAVDHIVRATVYGSGTLDQVPEAQEVVFRHVAALCAAEEAAVLRRPDAPHDRRRQATKEGSKASAKKMNFKQHSDRSASGTAKSLLVRVTIDIGRFEYDTKKKKKKKEVLWLREQT
ncbi:hypothetical protein L249_3135 [Ophiocordyceps polyrhachis-furcata BCC 54312]|uniref:Uncharacterized protein n=1 Tax=Ophiocordyceps polyrhachis-furcata BCC 54312 TaxID=1330021 RepID=A0A367LQS6_9HYPO|nr:hypothetical protein L249_3135 [Ophiocordyceps polyrhachis-furcata BCC 54312]